MNLKEALTAKLRPYELPEDSLELLLLEQGLQTSGKYDVSQKSALTKAAIAGLYQLSSLKKEQDGGSTQEYDSEALQKTIARYENELKGDQKINKIRDMTHRW